MGTEHDEDARVHGRAGITGIDWTGCDEIERIPGKVSGTPILKHRRVQADAVWENYRDGLSAEEVADTFDLPAKQVRAVIEFARKQAQSRNA